MAAREWQKGTLLDKYKSAAPHKAAAKKRTGRRVHMQHGRCDAWR
jgi:hypothetical protein